LALKIKFVLDLTPGYLSRSISQATKDYILSPFFYNHEWLFKKGDEALKIMNLSLNTGEKYSIKYFKIKLYLILFV